MGADTRSPDTLASIGLDGLSVENRSRYVMSKLVHDVVADAFHLNLHGAPAERVEKANGARLQTRGMGENG